MFKIDSLTLFNFDNQSYTYNFTNGINFFVGPNNTGKTEFYKFIDFMFGSSMNLKNFDWYKDSLKKATMKIILDGKYYWITRTTDPEVNYFKIDGDVETESIGLNEYKDKLNEIFAFNEVTLRNLKNFTDENLSYRTFTMFNFFGEKYQGLTRDFLDKCHETKYSVKLNPVLDYIFNKNIERITSIKNEIEVLKEKIKKLEEKNNNYNFTFKQINSNLLKINSNIVYNGNNSMEIREELSKIMNMDQIMPKNLSKSISELEVVYNNLTEQIKVYDNTIRNYRQNEKENENRELFLSNLKKMIEDEPSMAYLINPLTELIDEVKSSIAFGKYVISDETIEVLKKQQKKVIAEMKRQKSKFTCYSLEEKSKAIALIQAYLEEDAEDVTTELNECKKNLRKLKNELQELQKSDDIERIRKYSELVTNYYLSGKNDSEIIKTDTNRRDFSIAYLKRGNILQPVENNNEKGEEKDNLYLGSMARHTLIQLSGYLAFMNILVKEKKCPVIPLLVIDHLSQPFSDNNKKAVGKIIETFYSTVSKDEVQIFMFDDKEPFYFGIVPDHHEQLRTEEKSGFNPFYHENK